MRILFVASLHPPTRLLEAIQGTPPGETPPLFPPSMNQYHWALALGARGHEMDVFYRNLPGGSDLTRLREQRHTTGLTPRKLVQGALNRLPPRYHPTKRQTNIRLLDYARRYGPDVLWLVGDNTSIYSETLAEIKRVTGAKLIYASGTSPIVFSHAIERAAAPLVDLALVNDYYHGVQWLELGAKHMAALPLSAVTPDFHRPYDLSDDQHEQLACDVAFVGTLLPGHLYSGRVAALVALRDYDLGVWSVHEVPATLRPYVRGSALGVDMMRVMSAAKITVNTHGNFMRYGGNMRTFEAAGVGVCQLADDLPGTRTWFTPGENILTYTDPDDLREQVGRVLADDTERQRIAANGRAHVLAHHTYAHRAAAFEAEMEKIIL